MGTFFFEKNELVKEVCKIFESWNGKIFYIHTPKNILGFVGL